MYNYDELERDARAVLEANRRYTPATCCHAPRIGEPNPACEGCRMYPLSPGLPDPKNLLRACVWTDNPE